MRTIQIHTVRCSGKEIMKVLEANFQDETTSLLVVEKESDIPLYKRQRSLPGEIPDFEKQGKAILRGVYYKTASFYGRHRVYFDYVKSDDLIIALDTAIKTLGLTKRSFAYKSIKSAFEKGATKIRTVKVSGSCQWTSYKDYEEDFKRILDNLSFARIIDGYAFANDAPKNGKYGDYADIKY